MPKTTFISNCDICTKEFKGNDAEANALACEQSHPKAIEIIEQEYNCMAPQEILPQTITVKLSDGKTAKYSYRG